MPEFRWTTCFDCGTLLVMETNMFDARKQDGRTFYCPNGHAQRFTHKENEEKRLARENENLRRRMEWAEQDAKQAKERAQHEERRVRSARGHATRLRKRIAAGQCPCCSETFANVADHIARKHPKFKPEDEG